MHLTNVTSCLKEKNICYKLMSLLILEITKFHQICSIYFYTFPQIQKRKNISHDAFGSKLGRIHMQKQNLDNLQTRKMKGLKRKKDDKPDSQSPKKRKQTEAMET